MPGNTFGKMFQITTCGESHNGAIGVIIDGCPPNFSISEDDIQKELNRRKPGQSDITTTRQEEDKIKILSGVSNGKTLGTPILMLAFNKDTKSEDYEHLKNLYRPSQADYTYEKKYGIREWKGGGRASARETLARVAAGTVALKYLKEKLGIEILSYVEQVYNIKTDIDYKKVVKKNIESNIMRCPDKKKAEEMIRLVEQIKEDGDSVGGIIFGVIKNALIGLGEPVFDKLGADLGKAMLSINATKGFEYGSGFEAASMKGSEHNDEFEIENGEVKTKSNNAGGTLGGISSGEDIYFRVAFKPTATISKKQETINSDGEKVNLEAKGRHDPCVLPRAVPIVDAMAALVIMDHYLRWRGQCGE